MRISQNINSVSNGRNTDKTPASQGFALAREFHGLGDRGHAGSANQITPLTGRALTRFAA